MKLRELLVAKKNKEIVSVSPGTRIGDAIRLMAEKNIGDVLVMDGEKLVGIFTERDVVHLYAKKISFETGIISEVMTPDPVTFDESTDVNVVLSVMCQKNIRHLPVMREGRVAGVISFRDVVKYLMPEICYFADHIY
ncbi:MAG: CBS domain-containing protein [Thermodesulfovibrionales bacterium]|nr:CBS domain-containing protein [Thermodesulfovibrionales bacterium]